MNFEFLFIYHNKFLLLELTYSHLFIMPLIYICFYCSVNISLSTI